MTGGGALRELTLACPTGTWCRETVALSNNSSSATCTCVPCRLQPPRTAMSGEAPFKWEAECYDHIAVGVSDLTASAAWCVVPTELDCQPV